MIMQKSLDSTRFVMKILSCDIPLIKRKALGELFSRCALVAVELLGFLRNLNHKSEDSKLSKLDELQRIFRANETLKKFRGFEAQINAYQSQLTIGLLAYMNAKLDASSYHQDARLTQLQDGQSKVMGILALSQERIIDASVENNEKVLAAVLKLTDGGAMIITEGKDATINPNLNTLHMMRLQSDPSENRQEASLLSPQRAFVQRVLSRLKFRHIRDRYDTVKKKHGKTLEWVFESRDSNLPWSPFPSWFISDGVCYWINGKPGSGKTTLMKFISQDSRTKSLARTWAGHNRVLIASFFFWNLGPFGIQKSQSGLLRALLHDILKQDPTLILKVVPELCYDILEPNSPSQISEPTLQELERWFKRLLQSACPTMRLCFLIDGVDEYTGDLDRLLDVILGESNHFVKFIVSSRPTIPCEGAFSRYPSLRLQDLTQADIRGYAQETFNKRPDILQDLLDPESLSVVIEDITKRSSGVFLWVELVVKSLLNGITNGDSISELQMRLQQLPTDLAELHRQILSSIPPRYRFQAANFFRIMVQSAEYEACRERPYPVSALRMSFVENSHDTTISASIKAMSADEVWKRCTLVDRRIRSRCCGLLEINSRPTTGMNYANYPLEPYSQHSVTRALFVEFIHRSVVEFFAGTDELGRLFQGNTYTIDDPRISLFCSYVHILKGISPVYSLSAPLRNNNWTLPIVMDTLMDALDIENSCYYLEPKLLNELDRAMSYHYYGEQAFLSPSERYWVEALLFEAFRNNRKKPMSRIVPLLGRFGFRGIAVLLPLPSYVRDWLKTELLDPHETREVCTELLHGWALAKFTFAVNLENPKQPRDEERLKQNTEDDSIRKAFQDTLLLPPWTPSNTNLVQILLESGADPNRQIGDNPSAFHMFLCLTVAYQVHDEASAFHVRRMLELFASHGVTTDQVFPRHQWFEDRLFQIARRVPDLTWTGGLGTWTTVEFFRFVENHYKKLARKGVKVGNLEGIQSIVLGSAPGAAGTLSCENVQKKSSETTSVGRTGGVSVVERSWSMRLLILCSGRRK